MAVDLSVFERQKSVLDQQQLQEAFELKKAAVMQDIATQQAKANEFDIGKVGEQAFIKASQGMQLSPTEASALQYLDAKSPTAAFNPVTGVMEQKPSLLNRAGINLQGRPSNQMGQFPQAKPSAPMDGNTDSQVVNLFGGDGEKLPTSNVNEWDAAFQQQMDAAQGNPKLQQSIKLEYAKSKMGMTEAEAKAAGFADRMIASNPIIKKTTPARMDATQVARASIPLIGNLITSGDYQSFNQAQRDFINAQLRRESGAVISPEEFDNAEKQYFPKVGDAPEVILQKEANRNNAVGAMQRSSGAAYKPPVNDYKSKYGLK